MTTGAKSFHPPWATLVWVDREAIYIEIPTKAEPYITSFTLCEGGLSKALHYLKVVHKVKTSFRGEKINGKTKEHTLLKRAKPPAASEEQRETARSVLRKLKLI